MASKEVARSGSNPETAVKQQVNVQVAVPSGNAPVPARPGNPKEMEVTRSLANRATQVALRGRKASEGLAWTRSATNPYGTNGPPETAESAVAALLPDIDALQRQFKSTQQELEIQKQASVRETTRFAEKVIQLESQLSMISAQADRADVELSIERRNWRRVSAVAGVIAFIVICMLLWPLIKASVDQTPSAGTAAGGTALLTTVPSGAALTESVAGQQASVVLRTDLAPPGELPIEPYAALQTSLDRLDYALGTLQGISADEALHRASASGRGCALAWTGDTPSVVFDPNPPRQNSLANTLASCADAVIGLR